MEEPEQTTSPATVESTAPETTATPAASVETQTPPADEAVTAPEATPQKPDYKSLLKDPEFKKLFAEDEEYKRDYEHRVQSEAGRRAKAQFDAWQQQERQRQTLAQQHQRLERQKAMEEFDLGTERKQELAQEEVRLAEQQKAWEAQQRKQEVETQANIQMMHLLGKATANAKLADEEYQALRPDRFSGPEEYMTAVFKALTEREAKKLAKDIAKVETEARVQETLGTERERAPHVASVPTGNAANTEKEFLAEYASGRNNDHARAQRILAAL